MGEGGGCCFDVKLLAYTAMKIVLTNLSLKYYCSVRVLLIGEDSLDVNGPLDITLY